jgi:hypothetical protein
LRWAAVVGERAEERVALRLADEAGGGVVLGGAAGAEVAAGVFGDDGVGEGEGSAVVEDAAGRRLLVLLAMVLRLIVSAARGE